jgi:hypothetical protein
MEAAMSFLNVDVLFGAEPGTRRAASWRAVPYHPQPGDLVFFDEHSLIWRVLYAVAGSQPPDHCGVMVARPDGRMALLEAGPFPNRWVRLEEVPHRLQSFRGSIWVRRLKRALSQEQSTRLTEFAVGQEGKRYAVWRMTLQATPFQTRRLLKPFAQTFLNRRRWLCSELVAAAGTILGLIDPTVLRANAVYPRDIVDDLRYDLGQCWHEAALWRKGLPHRRTAEPVAETPSETLTALQPV